MTTEITCLFDPLCGWCYGAAPALARIAADPAITLDLQPTGLFAGPGARAMDAGFAEYAWSNDQRIARLTGQIFSEAYRRNVLDAGGTLDSGPATLALTAVRLTAPEQALAAAKEIQAARYALGQDITRIATLATTLDRIGLTDAARRLADPDRALTDACLGWIASGRGLMEQFGATGVPALIVGRGGDRQLLNASALFGDTDTLIARLRAA